MSVIVYSKNNCPACNIVKHWLKMKEVEYEERNVDADQKHRDHLVNELGYSSVPVTVVENHHIHGFDQDELQKYIIGGNE